MTARSLLHKYNTLYLVHVDYVPMSGSVDKDKHDEIINQLLLHSYDVYDDMHWNMVDEYNCYNSGHYPVPCHLFKKQRFGDWILSPKRCVWNERQDHGKCPELW
jgi:hypothetical protein